MFGSNVGTYEIGLGHGLGHEVKELKRESGKWTRLYEKIKIFRADARDTGCWTNFYQVYSCPLLAHLFTLHTLNSVDGLVSFAKSVDNSSIKFYGESGRFKFNS